MVCLYLPRHHGKDEERAADTDLDFLETHCDERVEHPQLALVSHRLDEGLVAVAQIHGTPDWRLGDRATRPSPVRQSDGRNNRAVFLRKLDRARRWVGFKHGNTSASRLQTRRSSRPP
jgi:hypothetical protein